MSKPLSLRQEQVLQATVHHYVDTMEPVGSRTLVQRFGIPASSAALVGLKIIWNKADDMGVYFSVVFRQTPFPSW